MKQLINAVQSMVLENRPAGMTVDDLCRTAFGTNEKGDPQKSQFTLYKEINPNDPTAKLGFVCLVKLMQATGDTKPLELMAALLGKVVIDAPESCTPVSPDNAYALLADAQIKLTRVLDILHSQLADKTLTKAELSDLFTHAHDAHAAIARFGFGAKRSAQKAER